MGGGDEERGDGGDGSGEGGGEEPRYCYCGDVSYGEMVGCDADDCSREWFHLSCVGLSRAPAKTGELSLFLFSALAFFGGEDSKWEIGANGCNVAAKWYCDECKENLRRR